GLGGRGWGRGSELAREIRPLTTTPTPPAFAALRRATLPTSGRVKTEFTASADSVSTVCALMSAKPTAGNDAGEAAARTKNRSSRYSEYPPSTTSVCAVTMLVSAHRNTIAAAISADRPAPLRSQPRDGASLA